MKKEVILVPKDKSILNFLKEMKEEGKFANAWIFVHENVVQILRDEDDACVASYPGCGRVWNFISEIRRFDEPQFYLSIDYYKCENPENIFFFKAEE